MINVYGMNSGKTSTKTGKKERRRSWTGEIIILRVITPVKIFSSFVKSDETDFTEASGNLF